MCGIISQQAYREGGYGEIVAEYTKEGSDPALIVRDSFSDYSAILSADGSEYKTFWYNKKGDAQPSNKQAKAAQKFLTKKGYTLKAPEPERVPGIAELATTYNRQPVEDTVVPEGQDIDRLSDSIFVQGRSLKQWDEVAAFNGTQPHEKHVHPTKPADREPTTAEFTAYINSLTFLETLSALAVMSLESDESGPLSEQGLSSLIEELTGALVSA